MFFAFLIILALQLCIETGGNFTSQGFDLTSCCEDGRFRLLACCHAFTRFDYYFDENILKLFSAWNGSFPDYACYPDMALKDQLRANCTESCNVYSLIQVTQCALLCDANFSVASEFCQPLPAAFVPAPYQVRASGLWIVFVCASPCFLGALGMSLALLCLRLSILNRDIQVNAKIRKQKKVIND